MYFAIKNPTAIALPNVGKTFTVSMFFSVLIFGITGDSGCLPFTSKTHLVSNCANGMHKFRLENPVRSTRFPFPVRSKKNGNIS